MSEIIDVGSFIWESIDNKVTAISLMAVISVVGLLWKFKRLRHPRYKTRVLASLGIALLNLFMGSKMDNLAIYFLIFLLSTGVTYILWISVRKPVGIAHSYINKIKKTYEDGYISESKYIFEKSKKFYITAIEKITYYKYLSIYFESIGEHYRAFETLECINQKTLFKVELENLYMQYSRILLTIGDVKGSTYFLEKLENKEDAFHCIMQGMIFIEQGDISKANEVLERGKLIIADKNNIKNQEFQIAQLYNNYAAVRKMENNLSDTLFYYQKARDYVKQIRSSQLTHTIYQNIIHTLYENDPENDLINVYLREYFELTDNEIINNAFELFNFKVNFARQKNQQDELLKYIAEFYTTMKFRLQGIQKFCFEISTLNVAFNSGVAINVIMNDVEKHYKDYFDVKMPDRFQLVKKLLYILERTNDFYGQKYQEIIHRCLGYIKETAESDLNEYYYNLDEKEIYARCNTLNDLQFLYVRDTDKYDFNKVLKTLTDITDLYRQNGLYVKAIESSLNIADECFRDINVDNQKEKTKYPAIMLEYTEKAVKDLEKINQHPATPIFYLRIATYYYFLGMKDKSLEYFKKFDSRQVNFLSDWLKGYYYHLSERFNTELAGNSL